MINLDCISEYCKKNNIVYGICKETYFENVKKHLILRNHLLKGFVEQDILKRIDAKLTMEDTTNILVFAKSYKKEFLFKKDNELRCRLSDNAIGPDYHITLFQNISDIIEILKSNYGDFNFKIFVDTGPLIDRELARRANLGDFGLSGNIITSIGSMVNLGYCLISEEGSMSKEPFCNKCNLCKKCVNSCPAKAISDNGLFDFEKCISYISQKKGILSFEEMKLIGISLYGCDICQKVCPKNCNIPTEKIFSIDDAFPKIKEILSLTNREFKNKFQNTAIGWRGNTVIKRNALIALGNLKNKEASSILKEYMENENEILRETEKKAYLICTGEI